MSGFKGSEVDSLEQKLLNKRKKTDEQLEEVRVVYMSVYKCICVYVTDVHISYLQVYMCIYKRVVYMCIYKLLWCIKVPQTNQLKSKVKRDLIQE